MFRRADLYEATLEAMELPGGCFEGTSLRGALMTASRMPMADYRGANLVGARIENADFYLVDLRDAIYTPDQEEHLRQCGAILKQRV